MTTIESKTETKITVIVENKPARLIAVMPTYISQGEYFIEVRTTFSASGKPMKKIKCGRYHKILTVV
jgi:DNA-binding transcriptional regulator YdaS (Cro superfamily)